MKKPLFLAALLCGSLMAVEAYASLKAPGFKFDEGKVTLSPVVNVGAFWDSNAKNTSHDEKSGGGWRIQPALSLSYVTQRTTLGLNGFYTMERGFDSKDGLDSDSYGESFSLSHQFSQKWRVYVSQAYTRSENDEFYWNNSADSAGHIDTTKSEHYSFNTGVNYTPNDRWTHSASVGWSRTHELDGNRDTSDSYSISYMVGRKLSERTNWNNSLSVTLDDPERGSKSTAYYLMTGVGSRASARTAWNAMVGVSYYDYSGDTNDTSIHPTYSISGSYIATQRIAFSLAATSSYKPENTYDTNKYYIWNHNIIAGMNVQFTDVWSGRLDASFNLDDHIGNSQSNGDYMRTYFQIKASTYYSFNDYISLYSSISWRNESYDEKWAGSDKDNVRLDIGLSFKF